MGDTCVNVGCVPSKDLIYRAKLVSLAKRRYAGVKLSLESFDFSKVIKEELDLVNKLRQEKYHKVLENLEHVDFVEGRAKFIGKDEIGVGGERIKAKKFIISVGSKAISPEIPGLESLGF